MALAAVLGLQSATAASPRPDTRAVLNPSPPSLRVPARLSSPTEPRRTPFCLGLYMGVRHDLRLAPVHGHLNLLGWAWLGLYALA